MLGKNTLLQKLGLKKTKVAVTKEKDVMDENVPKTSTDEIQSAAQMIPDVERDDEFDDNAALKAVESLSSGVEAIAPSMYSQSTDRESMVASDVKARGSKSGWMIKRGGSYKSWKKRFFVVVNRSVYYFPDDEKSLPLGQVVMERADGIVRAEEETGKDFSFKIVTRDRVLYCSCDTDKICQEWIEHLQATANSCLTKEVLTKSRLQGFVNINGEKPDEWIEKYCAIHKGIFYVFDGADAVKPDREFELKGAIVKRTLDEEDRIRDDITDSDFIIELAKIIDTTRDEDYQNSNSNSNNGSSNNRMSLNNRMSIKAGSGSMRMSMRKSFGLRKSFANPSDGSSDPNNFFANLTAQIQTKESLRFRTEDEDSLIWEKILQDEVDDATNSWASNNALMKGWLYRRVPKDNKTFIWKNEYFVLSNTHLYYFEDDEAREVLGKINVVGKMITKAYNETRRPFSFKVETTKTLYLSAASDDECECWLEGLKEVSKTTVAHAYTKSGYLTKQGGSYKSWKSRFCVLKGTFLYYFKDPSDKEPKGRVKLAGQMIRHLTPKEASSLVEKENVLQIYTAQRTWYMYAEHEQDAIEWAIVLRKAALLFRGNTIEVNCNAKSNKTSAGNDQYKTIQEAVVKANDMDRIIVRSGTYNEQVTIKKSLIIEGSGEVILKSKSTPLVFEAAAACRISNLTITQVGDKENCAVMVKQGNIMIEHCEISSESGCGVEAIQECQVTMNSCQVSNCKLHGIWLKGTSSGLFENNVISDNGWDGVNAVGDSDMIIRQCQVYLNSYNGLYINSQGRIMIDNNEICQNQWDGVSINSKDITCKVYDNQIYENCGFGIYFARAEAAEGVAVDNEVFNNIKAQIKA